LPWHDAVLRTSEGVPYLSPDVQLLSKSAGLRPKDQVDAEAIIPGLDERRRARLAGWLREDHPWQELLGER
jgi:hypothetical protein